MMKCLILEDQPPAQRILLTYIEDLDVLSLSGVFADPLDALAFLKNNDVDIIYLDIHLPKISGLHFLRMLQNPPKIILTTAFADYALESYELDVVDYLLKPFSFERFVQATQKAVDRIGENTSRADEPSVSSTSDKIFVKAGTEYLHISLSSIYYISAEGDYTMVHTQQGRHLISHSLRYWRDHLPEKMFCQVHKSYIVQIDKISKVVGNKIHLEEGEVPIGRTYKDDFANTYLR